MTSGCSSSSSDSADPYVLPGSGASVALVDGAYHWQVIDPESFGGSIDAIAVIAPNDVWFFGRDARHWDGTSITRMPLVAAGTPGAPDYAHFAQTFAVRSASDIWIAGSALWHYDGQGWTEKTSLIKSAEAAPTEQSFNQFELASDDMAMVLAHIKLGVTVDPRTTGLSLDTFDGAAFVPGLCLPGQSAFDGPGTLLFVDKGMPGAVGAGVCNAMGQVTPGLAKGGQAWARKGDHFYSYVPGRIGGDTDTPDLSLAEATLPGDYAPTLSVPFANLPGLGKFIYVDVGPSGNGTLTQPRTGPEIDVDAVTITDDGALYVASGNAEHGQASFFVRVTAGKAELLPDRLEGYQPFALAAAGDQVFVAASGGAILMGSKQ
jgi:hypothetical protein